MVVKPNPPFAVLSRSVNHKRLMPDVDLGSGRYATWIEELRGTTESRRHRSLARPGGAELKPAEAKYKHM